MMENLIDVFAQNKTTASQKTTTTSKNEGTKDSPSLFDSLLKNSAKNIEKAQKEIKTTEVKTPEKQATETTVLNEEKNSNLEDLKTSSTTKEVTDKKDITSQEDKQVLNKDSRVSTSLLDRLILEAKNGLKEETVISKSFEDSSSQNSIEDEVQQQNEPEEGKIKITLPINSRETKEISDNENIKVEVSKEYNIKIDSLDNKNKEIDAKTQDIKIDNKLKLNDTLLDTSKQNSVLIVNEEGEIVSSNNGKNIIDNLLVTNDNIPTVQVHVEEKKQQEAKKSLMDYLIEKNSQKNIVENKIISNSTDVTTLIQEGDESLDEFVSNIYLGGQKNSMTNQFLFNKNEVLKLLQNGTISLEDIEKSATILDLELEDLSVEQDDLLQNLKNTKQDINLNDEKKVILNTLLNEKNIRSADIKNLITQSVEASRALLDNNLNVVDDVTLNVNPSLLSSIQSRIIGAQQHISQMMSDIARQMYDNYKPPVTVFKINLNPAELGSIAILMKSSKSSSLDISMSVSNMSTLDALLNNQNILRSSLLRTFSENMQFNLDFSSSNQSNRGNEQSSNRQSKKFEDKIDTQSVLKLKEENKNRDDSLDYM